MAETARSGLCLVEPLLRGLERWGLLGLAQGARMLDRISISDRTRSRPVYRERLRRLG
jgi:hypothetical protein